MFQRRSADIGARVGWAGEDNGVWTSEEDNDPVEELLLRTGGGPRLSPPFLWVCFLSVICEIMMVSESVVLTGQDEICWGQHRESAGTPKRERILTSFFIVLNFPFYSLKLFQKKCPSVPPALSTGKNNSGPTKEVFVFVHPEALISWSPFYASLNCSLLFPHPSLYSSYRQLGVLTRPVAAHDVDMVISTSEIAHKLCNCVKKFEFLDTRRMQAGKGHMEEPLLEIKWHASFINIFLKL